MTEATRKQEKRLNKKTDKPNEKKDENIDKNEEKKIEENENIETESEATQKNNDTQISQSLQQDNLNPKNLKNTNNENIRYNENPDEVWQMHEIEEMQAENYNDNHSPQHLIGASQV